MKKWNTKQILESLGMHPVGGIGRAASAELRRLHSVNQELMEALQYAVKQVPELATVPGIAAAIAKATGGQA